MKAEELPASPASIPANIDVSLSQGVTILWQDGHRSHYAIAALRAACPCATCRDLHGSGAARPQPAPAAPTLLPIFKPSGATLTGVTPVGHYALQFAFDDGHNTGIFTWEHLRQLCGCADCQVKT